MASTLIADMTASGPNARRSAIPSMSWPPKLRRKRFITEVEQRLPDHTDTVGATGQWLMAAKTAFTNNHDVAAELAYRPRR